MKKQLLLFVIILLPLVADAWDVKIDNIYYNFNSYDKTAEVTRNISEHYAGDIVIPESIIYNMIEYTVTIIDVSAFQSCSNLTSVSIPNSMQIIRKKAFADCNKLTSIIIPSGISYVSDDAFKDCNNLSSLTILCKEINFTFKDLTSITNVVIGEGVIKIGDNAFSGCKNIESIELGSTITNIGSRAFAGLDKLTNVTCKALTVPDTDRTAFESSYIDYVTLHVPEISLEAYKTTAPWSGFKSIVEIEVPKYALIYLVDGEVYKEYRINEGAGITPEEEPTKEGYTFSGWSEIPETMPAHDVTITGTFVINKYKLIYIVDGADYKFYEIEYGAKITPESAPTKEGYTFSGWSEIPETMPAHNLTVTGSFAINKYKLIYKVDGAEYKAYEIDYGSIIMPELAPTKEGYTFIGWSEIPATMPAHDVTVTGSFAVNKYKLIYKVDGAEYKTYEIEFGTTITPEAEPKKEGYTFSGWSWIPTKMPAEDVTVTGTFKINKYKLIYKIDGAEYKTYEVEFGVTITPETEPKKDGYTFSGWSWIPTKMPAEDVIVTGTFTINKYKLIYKVDGAECKSYELDYGSSITPEPAPTKEGYTFSGWSGIPETMPAHDVTITGSFTKGAYNLTYMVDGEVYKTLSYDYGATITPEPAPTKEGYTFSGWSDIPQTMPAQDVTVIGIFTINKYKLIYKVDGAEYKSYELDYGSSITPEPAPTKEGYTFSGWSGIPETMPAHDVTVTGLFTVNQYTITYIINDEVYTTQTVDYGSTIIPPTVPEREGYDFVWGDYPETMPAYDITIYGIYTTGIDAIMAGEVNCQIFSLDGKPLNELQKGVNIVRMYNGQVHKIVVK